MKPLFRYFLVLVLGGATGLANAQNCAGFADVQASDPFCPSVEWLRNRAITLGCTTTEYCPSNNVIRLSMAAFMQRLGVALTPVPVVASSLSTGVLDLDASPVVCVTSGFTVTGFPRRAYVDASVAATAAGDLDFGVAIVASTDSGITWNPLNASIRSAVLTARWGHASAITFTDLDVGQTVSFGVRLSRADSGATDVIDARCSLRATVASRDGVSSPF